MIKYPALFLLICSLLSGCKATYPHEKIEESIKKICADEYKLNVQTKITGFTVYAYIELSHLISEAALQDALFVDQLSNVMSSLSRVVLSSDYPFQFIVLHVINNDDNGTYMTLTRHVDDIRRLLTGDISHNEFFDRMVLKVGTSPRARQELFVLKLFDEINLRSFPDNNQYFNLFSSKNDRSYSVETLTSYEKSDKNYLVFCRTREMYPKMSKNGLIPAAYGEYIIELDNKPSLRIKNILPIYSITDQGEVIDNSKSREVRKYGSVYSWKSDLPDTDIVLSEFLAEQISDRIKKTIEQDERWSNKYLANSVTGSFIPIDEAVHAPASHKDASPALPSQGIKSLLFKNRVFVLCASLFNRLIQYIKNYFPHTSAYKPDTSYGVFEFSLDVQERILFLIQKQFKPSFGGKKTDLLEDINTKIIRRVLSRYGFNNFKEIRIININTGQKLITAGY